MKIPVTRWTSHNRRLTKFFYLNDDGELQKQSATFLTDGTAETFYLSSLEELQELHRNLNDHQAVSYGVVKGMAEKTRVSTLGNPKDGCITRSRNSMEWPQGPGVLLLDVDAGDPPTSTVKRLDNYDKFGDLLREAMPELDGVGIYWTASAGSHIYKGEQCLRGCGGYHAYCIIDSAVEIPRVGKILAQRCLLTGHARVKVTASGLLVVRQLIDALVWQPERLDYAAGAKCRDPLRQVRPEPVILPGGVLKASDVKALTESEQEEYDQRVTRAKDKSKDPAEKVRQRYIDLHAERLVKDGKAQDLDQARKVIKKRITPNARGCFELVPDDLLLFDNPSIGSKSVAEILSDPAAYHDHTLADPHEPEEGRCKARLYANPDGSVLVHSMVHGAGNVFVLRGADKPVGDDPFSWAYSHMITEDQAQTFDAPDFAYDGFIVNGHIIVIAGPANSGKTTIMLREVCPVMVKRGYRVIYINVDVASVDTRQMRNQAEKDGIDLLVPEVAGSGVDDVIKNLNSMSRAQTPYNHTVIVLDTLKKFADLISKSETRKFLSMLRRLTGKGATVICLAHNNKRPDGNGKQIFEGVGDIKNDADELIYLVSEKQHDGTVLVSTEPDKTRARLTPLTFRIELDRSVTPTQRVDILDRQQKADQFAQDQDIIEAIVDLLGTGECNQTQIVNALYGQGISARQARRVLQGYADPNAHAVLWTKSRDPKNNQTLYALTDQQAVCTPQGGGCANVKTVNSDQSEQGDQTVQTQ
jgi:hypothetical protein